ncbi:unnamed protein product [Thelazia callipaeda]|uniref:Myosin motor domain-containing protein n=1 Tax=Thelazia callipaeda TaxID=103827 RepID=A0A0N5DB31_THECL|nr:unnamed protein product [Thelazia callipaeda]
MKERKWKKVPVDRTVEENELLTVLAGFLKKITERLSDSTCSGLFCVVINPYEHLPIYTQSICKLYIGKRRNEMPPHLFAVSDEAYRNMINELVSEEFLQNLIGNTVCKHIHMFFAKIMNKNLQDHINQSMLINGESGAGKTENTNKFIAYFTIVGATHANNINLGNSEESASIEDQIIRTSPVLEAFYLLEKSRVIKQAPGERCYHIFYQIMSGQIPGLKVNLALGALAKAMFARMFAWLIKRCNGTLDAQDRSRDHFIGVLDIAGFEIFDFSSFEQLWINFVNEKLQQFFNYHMFVLEQQEYQKEGIQWEFNDFGLDLQACIELTEKCKKICIRINFKPLGIISVFDEECIVPKASDLTLVQKLDDQHFGKHPNFQNQNRQRENKSAFIQFHLSQKLADAHLAIVHYAGTVRYNLTSWLEKNKDPLNDSVISVLKANTGIALMSQIWDDYKTQEDIANLEKEGKCSKKKRKSSSFMTVSMIYRESLSNLMAVLYKTYSHFIRCIIPNEKKKSGKKFVQDEEFEALTKKVKKLEDCLSHEEKLRMDSESYLKQLVAENEKLFAQFQHEQNAKTEKEKKLLNFQQSEIKLKNKRTMAHLEGTCSKIDREKQSKDYQIQSLQVEIRCQNEMLVKVGKDKKHRENACFFELFKNHYVTFQRHPEKEEKLNYLNKICNTLEQNLDKMEDDVERERGLRYDAEKIKRGKNRSEMQAELEKLSDHLTKASGITQVQVELNKRREAELNKLHQKLDDTSLKAEIALASLRKKHNDAVVILSQQLDSVQKARVRYCI